TVWRLQDARDVGFDFGFQLRSVGERVAIELVFYGVENFAGGLYAEIGGEQGAFEVFESRGIDLFFAEENVIDGFRKGGFGLRDGGFQPLEERAFGFAEEGNHQQKCSRWGR